MSELESVIKSEINKHTTRTISFARFMELALYHPNLGYYMNSSTKIGSKGDFTTAPEVGELFAKCLVTKLQFLKEELGLNKLDILEIGAGTGKLAKDICKSININSYKILEISPYLRGIQQQTTQSIDNIFWVDDIPDNFYGVVIANELIDAMPVNLFKKDNDKVYELGVTLKEEKFIFAPIKPSPKFKQSIKEILPLIKEEQIYISEANLAISFYINKLATTTKKVALIFIDYGFLEHEYYHPIRNTGTLMCHYKHTSHPDPFVNIGKQDITAHVNFSKLAEILSDNDFDVEEYKTFARFLLDNNLLKHYESSNLDKLKLNQEINTLTSPAEMGELFKVMIAIKG